MILNSIYLLPWILRTGSLLQGLVLKKVPKESGLHLRFSLPYLDKNRLIPSLISPFFLHRFPERIEGKEGGRRIGLFYGCSINYLFPSIGEASIRLLTRNGFSVILPKDQTCCGLLAYGSGDLETAKSLARKNIRPFDHFDIDQILVPCGSCFYFLKEGYLKLFPNDQNAKAFSKKIVEPSVFFGDLISQMGANDASQFLNPQERITYHDPCHLRRGMKIYQEPRRLLKSLSGVELVEMKQPDRCCGMAGSFNLVYYGLSQKSLLARLMISKPPRRIMSPQAVWVVSSN